MNLSYVDFMSVQYYALSVRVISPTAFNKAANGDVEKGKVWARLHPVGTGAFKFVDFKRDNVIIWEKFDHYWQKGMPYLDRVEMRLIPDPMTATAMIQAGEADAWASNANIVPSAIALADMGYTVHWGIGLGQCFFVNGDDPNQPFAKKQVREALEYAIDRPALANMMGQGKFKPMKQLSQEGYLAYMPDYNPRPYNPEKAVKLLAEAGYPKGFKSTILTNPRDRELAAAVQGYLRNVGISVNLDVADPGRYYTIYRQGWKELLLAFYGINPDNSDLFFHFGPHPVTFRKSIPKSPEFLKACEDALEAPDLKSAKPLMQKIVRQVGKDAMIIPLYTTAAVVITQKNYHTKYLTPQCPYRWEVFSDWKEK
jgi:peptide/nickel transport system substrate-binding protein